MSAVITVFLAFARLGLLSFGSVNLAAMSRAVVEQHHWLTREQFVQGYALGQLLPGPNVLCVILYGYAGAGAAGGAAALLGFFLPPSLLVLAAFLLTQGGSAPLLRLYRALLPVGAGLLLAGLFVLARGSLKFSLPGLPTLLIAVVAFLVARSSRVPAVLAVILGLVLGALLLR